jgi:23S rRNA (cytosine1962-C5)-methyltransferase/23S rRNA (guanine2445-N2)-methyltransferase / 23S rRNA (guanine2069-N7)-methyltransferase
MENSTIIYNRLIKNKKKLKNFLKRENISCYRLYEKDIPEYPYLIDVYENKAIVFEKGKKLDESELSIKAKHLDEVVEALQEIFDFKRDQIVLKTREKKTGATQYDKLAEKSTKEVVNESGLKFYTNFYDYLDTGIFLDHRPLRKLIRSQAQDKKVLNLFAYTGSISVYAASGGAQVTTVDLSNTYINWAKENFKLNELSTKGHSFVVSDVFAFLKESQEKHDIIIIDPPSFSNSKKIDSIFDVQRDHKGLIELAALRLNTNGVIYFSNNFRKFKLDEEVSKIFKVKDMTFQSIPEDFRDKRIHSCFKITKL